MLSKAKIQLIRSLEHKKFRAQHGLFVIEGDKAVRDLLVSSMTTEYLLAKPDWLDQLPDHLSEKANQVIEINDKELSQISFQKTPNQVIALARIPENKLNTTELTDCLSLYLNRVQDPGNLGTIIRLADWFGIRHVLCDEGCADPFHPKTVQSTMGSIIRVKTHQTDESFFQQLEIHQSDFPVFGTFLNGENLYQTSLSSQGIIVMGNESKGINDEVAKYVNRRLLIPPYPLGKSAPESLNVATATAIVCAEFRRRLYFSQMKPSIHIDDFAG